MISKEELQQKTGHDSFLTFKKNCKGSAPSQIFSGLTKYFYDKGKIIELGIRPEELFMAADAEINKNKDFKKTAKHSSIKELY
jgi:hypothetical protein